MATKKQIHSYSFYDLDGMQDHLEIMAQKGWFPKKLGSFFWQYQQGEPKKLSYRVCYTGEADAYSPKPGQKETSFRENAEAKGWKQAAANQKIQVYASEQADPQPVSVSPYDRITGVKQAAKPAVFLYGTMIVLALFSILMFSVRLNMMPVGVLADSFGQAITVALSLLSIYCILDLILYFCWKNKAEIAATRNEYEKTGSHGLRVLKSCIVLTALILGVIVFSSGRSPLFRTFVGYLVGILILMLILALVRAMLLKKGVSVKTGRKVTRTVNIVIAVILVAGITLSLNQMQRQDRGTDGEMPVTVENLFYDTADREVESYSRTKETFLLRYTEAYQSAQADDGSYETLLSYEMADGKMVSIEESILDYYLHRTEGVGMAEDGTPIFQYREMDSKLWGSQKAWRMYREGEAQNVYLILYEDRLVELGAAWALTEQQMRLCGKKF